MYYAYAYTGGYYVPGSPDYTFTGYTYNRMTGQITLTGGSAGKGVTLNVGDVDAQGADRSPNKAGLWASWSGSYLFSNEEIVRINPGMPGQERPVLTFKDFIGPKGKNVTPVVRLDRPIVHSPIWNNGTGVPVQPPGGGDGGNEGPPPVPPTYHMPDKLENIHIYSMGPNGKLTLLSEPTVLYGSAVKHGSELWWEYKDANGSVILTSPAAAMGRFQSKYDFIITSGSNYTLISNDKLPENSTWWTNGTGMGQYYTVGSGPGWPPLYEVPGGGVLNEGPYDPYAHMSVPCFLPGTLIRTPDGDIPVEELRVGQDVIAFVDNNEVTRTIEWIGKGQSIADPELPLDLSGFPVRIKKDALFHGCPYKDLLVTSEHCLFLNGHFVPVRMLVNGYSIFYDETLRHYDYYHIELEQHSILLSDGLLSESYLDTGHSSFVASSRKTDTVVPLVKKSWEKDAAAPLMTDRAFVEDIYKKLELRAKEWGFAPVSASQAQALTDDPDLFLRTPAGNILRPKEKKGGRYFFTIDMRLKSLHIVSRTSRPCDVIGPYVDDRRTLGVLVGAVTLLSGNNTYSLTDHLNSHTLDGWDVTESSPCRWTNGDALLPLDFINMNGIGTLMIEILAAGPYPLSRSNVHQPRKENVS